MGCGASTVSDSEVAILEIGELLHDASHTAAQNPDISFHKIRLAEAKLARVDDFNQDHYAILVYSREGKLQYGLRRYQKAIEAYTKAVHIAEVKIGEKVRGLYLLLQRYAECMCDIASIWQKSAAAQKSESKQLRETGKAELVLLRCIETIEEGHNRRSDLLVDPLMMLARLYEDLKLFSRAELLVRRVSGILIVTYGHEHPLIAETKRCLESLVVKKEAALDNDAAVTIQSIFRMRREMRALEGKLGRPAKRHVLQVKGQRSPTPTSDFLTQLAAESVGELGDGSEESRRVGDAETEQRLTTGASSPRSATIAANDPAAAALRRKAPLAVNSPRASDKNPLDAATRPKPFVGVMEPVLSGDQVPPRLWTVEGAFDEEDIN